MYIRFPPAFILINDIGLNAVHSIGIVGPPTDSLPFLVTAIGSTEGADRKFPFSAVFDPLQRIVSSSLSSAPFALKPG
jgi:hypothetical protein